MLFVNKNIKKTYMMIDKKKIKVSNKWPNRDRWKKIYQKLVSQIYILYLIYLTSWY